MKKTCDTCKHSVDLGIVIDNKKSYACKEVFYQKTKYDNLKEMTLTAFIPVISESDTCKKYDKK
jgi:hypothetical protein